MNKTPLVDGMAVKEAPKEPQQANVFVFDDTSYREVIFDNLNKLRKNKQFCDVTLQVFIIFCYLVIQYNSFKIGYF